MPDLILHGDEGVKRWENEKCVSCKLTDDLCPLIRVLIKHTIESFAGIHIYSCARYEPDTAHPLFIETQAEKNKNNYETQIARLKEAHARSNRQ